MTLYRMTMRGVYDLRDKNTGDVSGDAGFVINRRTKAYQCRQKPDLFACQNEAQFSGDDANNTDLVLEMNVEVDGQWSPYLACNPVNNSNNLGPWICAQAAPITPVKYPEECKLYDPLADGCFKDIKPFLSLEMPLSECCNYGEQNFALFYQYNYETKKCSLFNTISFDIYKCNNTLLGFYDTEPVVPCQCERTYTAVGKGASLEPATKDGLWYSHPKGGECVNGHFVGDGSGCTYRVIEISKAINASCLY